MASPSRAGLRVGGFVGLSACDWPGELVATVFCQGCPWRCRYCHNHHLRDAAQPPALPWPEVVAFLRQRVRLLDGVVFSGGEPTVQRPLASAMREVRALGFRVGLHTAGPAPQRLAPLLGLLDWVGFDVKARFADYPEITGIADSGACARESLRMLLRSGVAHEVRTTVHPELISLAALEELTATLAEMGVRNHVLQLCRAEGCADRGLAPADRAVFSALTAPLAARFATVSVRE